MPAVAGDKKPAKRGRRRKGGSFSIPDRPHRREATSDNVSADIEADDKDDLLSNINDKILRRIFSGVVEAVEKRTP